MKKTTLDKNQTTKKRCTNRFVTVILLLASLALSFAAAFMGIDDNPPGILLVFVAGIALVLAFTHTWRTPRKFFFLLLAAVLVFFSL
jgi:fatty acid desaturase